jgi:hypothetical protein
MLREETLVAVRESERTSISDNKKDRLACGPEKELEKSDLLRNSHARSRVHILYGWRHNKPHSVGLSEWRCGVHQPDRVHKRAETVPRSETPLAPQFLFFCMAQQ